jgi:hypothetical protein
MNLEWPWVILEATHVGSCGIYIYMDILGLAVIKDEDML